MCVKLTICTGGRVEASRGAEGYSQDGILGLKVCERLLRIAANVHLQQLGVRDLTYKLAFLASVVQPYDSSVSALCE